MSWNLEGTYFENCNCDSVCPCTTSAFAQPADNERCLVTFAIHIDSGSIDGLDVGGRDVIMVFDTPGSMGEGGWQAGLIIDDQATDEQAEGLTKVLAGQAGGPMAALAPLIGEMLGVERAPIEYINDGKVHSVRAGDYVNIEITDTQQVSGGPIAGLTGIAFHPMNSELTIAKANRATVNAFGKQWDNTGKNGHAAPFSWTD
ncbi:MAG: DUF1326 domain-containing protein [Chloroflexi bacterium]|nr:DUF1326 domain-containing protein [Chloroflexota bacterium]